MKCRCCKMKLNDSFVDLGFAPPSNSYLEKKELSSFEIFYPLRVLVCNKCFFVQNHKWRCSADLKIFVKILIFAIFGSAIPPTH